MGQHVILDLVLRQTGAAVTAEFVPTPIFYVYALTAVLQLLLFSVPRKIVAADRALDQGRKDVGIVTAGRVCLRGSDLPELLELGPCDVRFTVIDVIFVAPGVGFIFKQTVYFVAGRRLIAVFL